MAEDLDNETAEEMDPSVPTDLLQLHLDLEDARVTPEEFSEVFKGEG